MGETLAEARLMAELLPKATAFGRQGGKPSNKGWPDNDKPKPNQSLKDEENTGRDKAPKQWYKIKRVGPKS